MPLKIAFREGPVDRWCYVDFSHTLHHRGSDFNIYKNEVDTDGFETVNGDSELLRQIVKGLMADDTGIDRISVKPYTLEIWRSRAVSDQDIIDRLIASAKRAQCVPVLV